MEILPGGIFQHLVEKVRQQLIALLQQGAVSFGIRLVFQLESTILPIEDREQQVGFGIDLLVPEPASQVRVPGGVIIGAEDGFHFLDCRTDAAIDGLPVLIQELNLFDGKLPG